MNHRDFAPALSSMLLIFIATAMACGEPVDAPKGDPLALQYETEVLRLTNEARSSARQCGDQQMPAAPALVYDPTLARAARAHASDMAQRDFFDHENPDGQSAGDRITGAGYAWSSYAENIGIGYSTPEDAVNGWLESPGHCKNLMSQRNTELGVGFHQGDSELWVQKFAMPIQTGR